MTVLPVLDSAGRRRSPATMPGYHAGRSPRNKGMRYPADPPTIEEIIAVMRQVGTERHGARLRAVIVVHRANRDYEAYRARGVMKDGRRFGRPPNPHTPPAEPEGKVNTTDPDAKRMKFGRNFMPAYNAQAVSTEDQIIVAAEITTEGVDFEQLDPMISAAERELEGAGVTARPEVVLADAGYWSNGHIDSLRERGMTPIVAPDTTRNRPRKTRLGGPYDFMRRAIATESGGDLYSRRKWMVEPVFAQIKANRRIERFKRRGRTAARSEWRLIAATHNLLKLHRHSLAAATA